MGEARAGVGVAWCLTKRRELSHEQETFAAQNTPHYGSTDHSSRIPSPPRTHAHTHSFRFCSSTHTHIHPRRLRDTKSGRATLLGLEHANDCCGFAEDSDRAQGPCKGTAPMMGCKGLLLSEQKSGFIKIAALMLAAALLQLFGLGASLVSSKKMEGERR